MGIPLPENKKETTFPFHVFERYGVHIQAFVDFINGKFIIIRSSFPRNYFMIYTHILVIENTFQNKYISKNV